MHVRSGKNHEVSSTREQVSCEFVNTLICSAHFSKQFFLFAIVQIILKIDITHSRILRHVIHDDLVSGEYKT